MPIEANKQQVGPWTDGVRYDLPAEDLPPSALYAMQNTRLNRAGQLETRPGTAKYISSALGSTPTIQGLGQHQFDASTERVWTIAGTAFYEAVSGTWTARTGGVTITAGDDNTWQAVDVGGTMFATCTSLADVQIKWAAAGGNIANATVSSRFTKAKFCEWWDTRLWYAHTNANTDRAWYSAVATPETITNATDFVQTGRIITGMKAFGGALTVHAESGIWVYFQTSTAGVYSERKRAEFGTVAGRSLVTTDSGQLFFVRNDGIYVWDAASLVESEVSTPPQKVSGALDGDRYWDNINTARLPYCHAEEYPDESEIWFYLPYGTGQTDMNHIMVYNYQYRRWHGPFTGNTRNVSALIDDKPHAGGYDDGLVYDMASGTNDNGSAIDAWGETAMPAPAGTPSDVRWLYARHHFDAKGAWDVEVTQSAPGVVSKTDSFEQGGTFDAIGAFTIGTSAIAGLNRRRFTETDLWGYAPAIQLKYRNANIDEPFSLRQTDLMYRPIGPVRKESSGVE